MYNSGAAWTDMTWGAPGNSGALPLVTGSLMEQENTAASGALTFAITAQPSHGTVSLTNTTTGASTDTPNTPYMDADSFTFTVSNSGGTSSATTESITVAAASGGGSGENGSSGSSDSSAPPKSGGGALDRLSLAFLLTALRQRRRDA